MERRDTLREAVFLWYTPLEVALSISLVAANTITQKDTKLIYVQDAGTTTENSEYCDMTEVELSMVREKAKIALQ